MEKQRKRERGRETEIETENFAIDRIMTKVMQFRVKVLFQIESTAKFNMSYKKNFISRVSMSLLSYIFYVVFYYHQHSVSPFIFKKYILLRTSKCMIQNYSWLLCITYRKNRESHEVGLNIRFLKGILFRAGIKFRKFWEFDQNMRNFVPE